MDSSLNESIRSAFSFSAGDFEANERGILSQTQKENLTGYVKSRGCGTKAASLAMGLTVAFILGFFLLSTDPGSPGFKQAMPFMIGACGVFLMIFSFFLILGRIRSRDLKSGRISTAEGEIRTWKKEYSHGTGYFVEVGGTRFQLQSAEQMEVLARSSFFKIHYISNPPAHLILSLKALG